MYFLKVQFRGNGQNDNINSCLYTSIFGNNYMPVKIISGNKVNFWYF